MDIVGRQSKVIIDGVTYIGDTISIKNDKVIIDGKVQEQKLLNHHITVKVEGDVESITTGSGDITALNIGNVSTASGDVTTDNIGGNVSTVSGDVCCRSIGGNVSTVSGDIIR